ncbi:MAG: DNA mismatch repair endonuclease MutL, partial [Clostridia bacterium]|nr:DNA mismatch repair endonuclease MutL [Clostridia bacterium]
MGKINVLGFDVANLIAAGEVVDRPASIVKELIENAIDSGADEVTVEIKNGGISHIRVSDNGCGISSEDLPLAVLRHATSKIATARDLESISTLGFRGEALAAIAAVTKLKIYSRTADCDMGSLLICEGGEVVEFTDTGCKAGTTVIADEIFFNVPARRKFLKRDATEAAKITDIVEKTALSVPDISFRYIVDGEIRFITRGDGDLKGAVHSVLGKRISERLVKVDRSENGVRVSGYVSEVDLTFSKRSEEIFYVNGRCIR